MTQNSLEATPRPATGPQTGELEDVIRNWWEEVKKDRGGRGELRRCKDPNEVLLNPCFHRLRRALGATPLANRETTWMAAVARILVEVKEDVRSSRSFGARMGRPDSESTKSPVSDMRFRRLLQARSEEELLDKGRAALRLVKHHADVGSLGADLLWWNDRVRRSWAMDYYDEVAKNK